MFMCLRMNMEVFWYVPTSRVTVYKIPKRLNPSLFSQLVL